MVKVKIGEVKEDSLKPKIENKRLILYAGKNAVLFPDQITEVDLGCAITLPEGYIGIVTPYDNFIEISSVLVEGHGIVKGTFRTIQMRKGTQGGVKIKAKDIIATLIIIKTEDIELSYY